MVNNRTYESNAAATQFFNTKQKTASVEERILVHLISGFTLTNLLILLGKIHILGTKNNIAEKEVT